MPTARITVLSAAACALLAVALTGCSGTSVEASCTALISGASKSALTVSNLITNGEIGMTTLEAAADEVEGYIDPLREMSMNEEIAPLRDLLVADADKLLIAVRAYNTDDLLLISQNMSKTAVDIGLACN